MAHTIVWPKKKYFYPIGNTPPVSFTSALSAETPAEILLLGCGDPRSILYTVYVEPTNQRKLDFTCCDAEPAILARNVLLLTMIIDSNDKQVKTSIWNMFFHFYLDQSSLDCLRKQCQKLLNLSVSIEAWKKGKYSQWLQFCSTHTLAKLREQWTLYLGVEDLPDAERLRLRNAFHAGMQLVKKKYNQVMTAARSAGPVWAYVAIAGPKHYQRFWETGVTFDDAEQISAATFINPTFAYDSSGREFNVHYGTDPILAFHLAVAAKLPLSPQRIPSASELVQMVKQQFQEWCTAFRERINHGPNNIVIRLCVGDALVFSRALHIFATTNFTDSGMYLSPWEATQACLDGGGYGPHQQNRAPVKFDIIDTSNLTDHLGLVNILVVTLPLLREDPCATLYTNTLLAPGEVGGGLAHRACADIATLSLMLGIVPVSYVSGFATQTNAHETLISEASNPRQETILWKFAPTDHSFGPLQVAAKSLGNILFNIYLEMFAEENVSRFFGPKLKIGFIHYIRASFAALLALVKQRTRCDWAQAFDHMISLIERDKTLLTGLNYYQDLCCQLHIHGVGIVGNITESDYGDFKSRIFRNWEHIPPVVCIVFKVPRQYLKAMEDTDADLLGTPILQCELEGNWHRNIFSAVQFFFGAVAPSPSDPRRLLAKEDLARWRGNSPLIVSFYVPSWLLTVQTPSTQVRLSIRPRTSLTPAIYSMLGPQLRLFSADLLDKTHVHVTLERSSNPQELSNLRVVTNVSRGSASSPAQPITMLTDKDWSKASGLSGRITVDEPLQTAFRACPLADISVKQISPFSMLVSSGQSHKQTISFPYPIDGSDPKTRIARASSYIEVDVKLRRQDNHGLMKNPFPVVQQNSVFTPWNIHNINLAKSPGLDISHLQWLHAHLSVTLSDIEYLAKENFPRLERGLITNLKCTIDEMFSAVGQLQNPHQVFVLHDPAQADRQIVIFLNCLRLDLPSHTLIADACILPATRSTSGMKIITQCLNLACARSGIVMLSTPTREIRVWWQLLPALAERCRNWSHSATCKYRDLGVPDVPDLNTSPLCDCGRGKSLPPSFLAGEYSILAPFVTRVALGPFFSLSYLDPIGSRLRQGLDNMLKPATAPEVCNACGKPGQPRLMQCSVCALVKYCSKECQKKDWKLHRVACKNSSTKPAAP
ncbi:hypothetical protein DXG01_001610 [Tephrocybe rancida]|nr:hypothetical protein DXG01_001610 [Tephrocybe rancida]